MDGDTPMCGKRPSPGAMLDPMSIPWPPSSDPAWRAQAGALVRELQAVHAAAFGRVLAAEGRGPGRERDAAARLAASELHAAFARGLQARLLRTRDALAARGVLRGRFDEMVDGGWDVETFPCLWVDLHAMLEEEARQAAGP